MYQTWTIGGSYALQKYVDREVLDVTYNFLWDNGDQLNWDNGFKILTDERPKNQRSTSSTKR